MAVMSTVMDGIRHRLDQLLDEHRRMLTSCLDGLTEDEVRRRLVPSRTTLLGLVKHVTYVEGIWFDQAITGRTTQEIGIANSPDRSFTLREDDTITSIQQAHRAACEASRAAVADLALDAVVTGRGQHSLWAIYTHVLRELAQHCGHADILREQVLAQRSG